MQSSGFPKCAARAELLDKLLEQHPELRIETLHILGQIQSLGRDISSMLSDDLEQYGLTEGKFYVLLHLSSEMIAGNTDCSPSDIAEALEVTRGTVTGLLDGLERDGYITRHHDISDRRALTIRLTDQGNRFMDDFVPRKAVKLQTALTLTLAEQRSLIDSLSRIEQAVRSVPHVTA